MKNNFNQTQNIVQLKEKVNNFKKHILNLNKAYSETSDINKFSADSYYRQNILVSGFTHTHNQSPFRNTHSKLLNKYQRDKLNQITSDNNNLLIKIIKIQSNNSESKQAMQRQAMEKFRYNFIIAKFNDRKRSLTQISKENKIITKKLSRCQSNHRLSQCIQWKEDRNKRVKQYKQNANQKLPRVYHQDYRLLAEQQIQRERKKLTLNRPLTINKNCRR